MGSARVVSFASPPSRPFETAHLVARIMHRVGEMRSTKNLSDQGYQIKRKVLLLYQSGYAKTDDL
jgi:hypothetical protein